MNDTLDSMTMVKSRIFHGPFRYDSYPLKSSPCTIILQAHSTINMAENTSSTILRTLIFVDLGSSKGFSVAKRMDDIRIITIIEFSKYLWYTIEFIFSRNLLSFLKINKETSLGSSI